ncbi:MAG: hypothetical protein OXB98_04105 [Bryobacterales bacterium]|nr:hypothetical protein [Bryobacterales bacterium]
MSQEEQDITIAAAFSERSQAKKELACYRAKAEKIAKRLRKAAAALESEQDEQYVDVVDCPKQSDVEAAFSGIRRNKNLIDVLEERLSQMVPSWNQ